MNQLKTINYQRDLIDVYKVQYQSIKDDDVCEEIKRLQDLIKLHKPIEITYINRYNDKIRFVQVSKTEIFMFGGEYMRFGYSNNYTRAYAKYVTDYVVHNDYDTFIQKLYKFEQSKYVYPELRLKYLHLVTSTDTIEMVDPSGGPYISLGTDMSRYKLSGKVSKIEMMKDGSVKFTVIHE